MFLARVITPAVVKSICVFVLLIPATLHAQSYESVAPGSQYICGHMPDGSNLIFKDKNGNREMISAKKAVRKVKGDIETIQGRIERLKEIKASLKDGQLDASEIRSLKKIYVDGQIGETTLPRSTAERKEVIDALVDSLKIQIKNKRSEITALRDCSEGKAPNTGTTSLGYNVIKFKAIDGIYIALITFVPATVGKDVYGARWYCVRGGSETGNKGAPRLFNGNPCASGGPVFPNNTCASFVPPGMLANFYAFRIFKGVLPPIDAPQVIEAENEFRAQHAAGVVGRPRGPKGIPGDPATNADTCGVV